MDGFPLYCACLLDGLTPKTKPPTYDLPSVTLARGRSIQTNSKIEREGTSLLEAITPLSRWSKKPKSMHEWYAPFGQSASARAIHSWNSSYSQFLNHPWASLAQIESSAMAMPFSKASQARISMPRKSCLTLLHIFSIGFKSGLYGGKYKSSAPQFFPFPQGKMPWACAHWLVAQSSRLSCIHEPIGQ